MKYNCEEFIELLKYQQELKKQSKSLRTQDSRKYSKLLQYASQVSDYLKWCQKDEYLQLIKDFVNSKIDGKEFDQKFSEMVTVSEENQKLLSQNYEDLKRIKPSSMSLGFGRWISEIYLCCNEFYPSFKEEEDRTEIPFAKTEEQLRDAVKSLLPEIQKYF